MATDGGKLVALLLGVAGLGVLIYRFVVGRRMAEEQRNLPPVDPDVVAAEFEGIPLYPGAELDRQATVETRWVATHLERWMRPLNRAMSVLPGSRDMAAILKSASAVYTVEAPAAKVLAWYHKTLKAAGWQYREMPANVRWRARYPRQVYSRSGKTLAVGVRPAGTSGLTRIDVSLTAG